MDKTKIDEWAKDFVADLHVGGEAIPLDRVLARHLDTLNELRAYGLTWNAVASLIARAGGRRTTGRPISPDQLRANVSRLWKRRNDTSVSFQPISQTLAPTNRIRAKGKELPATLVPAMTDEGARRVVNPPERESSRASKEISKDDIAAALSRIQAK